MKSAKWPLQAAIYDRLSAALAVPVRSVVWDSLPYVRIGQDTANDAFGSHTNEGGQYTHTVTPYSTNDKECKMMAATIVEEITDRSNPLVLAAPFVLVRTSLEMDQLIPEETASGGSAFGNPLRFRFWIEEV